MRPITMATFPSPIPPPPPILSLTPGNARRLRVTAQPNVTLTMAHVPPRCRRARVMLLGPLMPADMDPASFLPASSGGRGSHALALMAQGLQRSLDAGKKVVPLHQPSAQLLVSWRAGRGVV